MFQTGLFGILCLCAALARQDPSYEDASQEDVPQEFGEDAPAETSDELQDPREQGNRMSFMAVNDRARSQQGASWAESSMDSEGIPASFARIAQNIQRWKKPAAKQDQQEAYAKSLHDFSQGWRDMGHDMASAAAQKEAMAVVSNLHINGHRNSKRSQPAAPQGLVKQSPDQAQGLVKQAEAVDDALDDADSQTDDDDNGPNSVPAEASNQVHSGAKSAPPKPAWYHVPKVERPKPQQAVPPSTAPVPEDAALADAADREIEAEDDAPGADIPPLFDDAEASKQTVPPQTAPVPQAHPKKQQQQKQQQKPRNVQQQQQKEPQEASPPSFPLDGPDGNEVSADNGSADDDAAIATALKEAGLSTEGLSLKNVDSGSDSVPPAADPSPSTAEPAAPAPSSDAGDESIPDVDQAADVANAPQAPAVAPDVSTAAAPSKPPRAPPTRSAKKAVAPRPAPKPRPRPASIPQAPAVSTPQAPAPAPMVDAELPAEQPVVIEQTAPVAAQAAVSDEIVDAAAHEEVARVRAELAAGEVARAAASRRNAVAMAQKLEQKARQMNRDSDAAWGRAQQAAAAAAQRAASEYKNSRMQKVKELEEKSRQASEQARRIRAAADAEVNRAMQRLGQISA